MQRTKNGIISLKNVCLHCLDKRLEKIMEVFIGKTVFINIEQKTMKMYVKIMIIGI